MISISIKSIVSAPYKSNNTTLEPSPGENTSWFYGLCQSWKELQMSALQKAGIAKGKGQLWDKGEKEIKKEFFVLQAASWCGEAGVLWIHTMSSSSFVPCNYLRNSVFSLPGINFKGKRLILEPFLLVSSSRQFLWNSSLCTVSTASSLHFPNTLPPTRWALPGGLSRLPTSCLRQFESRGEVGSGLWLLA